VETVLVDGRLERLPDYIGDDDYVEHNPHLADGASTLREVLESADTDLRHIDYHRVHRVLAEGNFILCVSEGNYAGIHSAFYDLFRVSAGKLAEHWDTTEKIAPRSDWKNNNGKF
jgi:predicted SnoaL-like aldol condensation-catalyzing enzyme